MSYIFENNAVTTLNANVLVAATSIVVNAPSGINQLPVDPTNGIATLTIVDSLTNPTKREIISYTGRTGAGPYTLTGVTKGTEGTTDQAWNANDPCYQALTAEAFKKSSGYNWQKDTSGRTLADNDGSLADTSGGSFTHTLPLAPSIGTKVIASEWGANRLIIARNGQTIEGVAADSAVDNSWAEFVFDGATWRVRKPFAGGAFRGAYVYQSAGQVIPSITSTAIAFDTELYDTDGIHDNITNNSRLTVPSGVTEVELILAYATTSLSASASMILQLKKNGVALVPDERLETNSSNTSANIGVRLVVPRLVVAAGDYFESIAWQNGSGNNTSNTNGTMFYMKILR